MTKSYRIKYWIFNILSLFCNIFPLAYFTIKALIEADLIHEKVALSMTVFIVLIMTAVSLFSRIELRSRIWIILIGLYACLDYIMIPLIWIASCQVIDELVICPLKRHYKSKLFISKEIDKRV